MRSGFQLSSLKRFTIISFMSLNVTHSLGSYQPIDAVIMRGLNTHLRDGYQPVVFRFVLSFITKFCVIDSSREPLIPHLERLVLAVQHVKQDVEGMLKMTRELIDWKDVACLLESLPGITEMVVSLEDTNAYERREDLLKRKLRKSEMVDYPELIALGAQERVRIEVR